MVRDKYLDIEPFVRERVHHLYYDQYINCARTTLLCLGELFNLPAEASVLKAAIPKTRQMFHLFETFV